MSVEEKRMRLLREVAEFAGTNPDKMIYEDEAEGVQVAVRELVVDSFNRAALDSDGLCRVCQRMPCEEECPLGQERARLEAIGTGKGE